MSSTSIAFHSATRAGLLLQARKGDRESLAKLILPYGPALYLGALRLTRNYEQACTIARTAIELDPRDEYRQELATFEQLRTEGGRK